MKESYCPIKEASEIVNAAFGNDYDKTLKQLEQVKKHAMGCGCGSCKSQYQARLEETVILFHSQNIGESYVMPNGNIDGSDDFFGAP